MDDARHIIVSDFTSAIGYIPRLAGALLIFLIGGAIAWILERLVTSLLSRIGLDLLADRTGLTEDLAAVGLQAKCSQLIGRLVLIIVAIAALVQGIDTLELSPLSEALKSLLNYMPHVVLAVIVVLVGVIVGDTLARGASGAMSRAGVLYHGLAGSFLRMTVIVLAILMALQQLTLESGFLLYVLLVVLAGAALAGGLAAGWGGRALAENLLAGRYISGDFSVGDFISVNGTAGKIERLSATKVVIVTDDGRRVHVPNGMLTRMAVESEPVPPV